MKKTFYQLAFLFLGGLLVFPMVSQAFSGTNVKNLKLKVYTEQGGEWFRSLSKRTDYTGVLEVKDVLPGWYKYSFYDKDRSGTQAIAIKARMLDLDGREIKDNTNVDLYYRAANGQKTFISTVETDDEGWVKVEGLAEDTEYKFELTDNDDSSVSQRDGEMRIKVNAKVDNSNWFDAYYGRTDENRVFETPDTLPGRYKFKYKEQDGDITQPFTLKTKLLNNKGDDLDEPTKVHLWAYLGPEKTLTFAGEVWTNHKGEIMVPGLMHGVKYKVEVFDN